MTMKVLTLWSAPYIGGAAKRFVELVDGLSSRGTDVVLLSAQDYPGRAPVCTERVSLPQGRFRTVCTSLSRRSFRDAETLLEKHRPDLVFTFGLANGNLLCRLARDQGIPSVLFVRMMELILSNNPNVPFSTVSALRGLGRAAYASVFRCYARSVFRRASAAVFQHKCQHEAYIRERLIDPHFGGSVLYLPNNSNPTWTAGRQGYQPVREPVTIIGASLFWNKGFRIAFDAFAIVRQSIPNARLVVLGDGRDGSAIRQYAGRIAGVEFRGRVPDIHLHYGSARLLLHPLLVEMGSPNTVLEAAGCGVPMIVSDELVHTVGKKAWVYPSHDHESLAKLWIAALTDERFHERLCRESRELGEQYRFDWVGRARDILSSIGSNS